MRWFPASCALALLACSSPGDRLALPPTEDGRALIWMVGGGDRPRLFAIDLAAGFEPSDLAVPVDGDAEIHAVVYPGTLASMQLVAGELVIDPKGLPLPAPVGTHVWKRAYEAGVASAWIELSERPAAFADLLILRRSPCGQFLLGQVASVNESGLDVMQEILRFSDDRLLFAASTDHHDPAFLLPLQNGAVAESIASVELRPIDAWSANEVDRAWVSGTATTGPQLRRIDVRGRTIARLATPTVGTSTDGKPLHASVLALATAGDVLFALTRTGFHRWDGAAWTTPFTTTANDVEGVNHQVYALSADEAIFTLRAGTTVGWYRRDQGVMAFPFTTAGEIVRTTMAHPQVGPILATDKGNFYRLDTWPPSEGAVWTTIGNDHTSSAGVMLPFEGGFIAAGIHSFWREHHFGYGFCPQPSSFSGLNVYHLVNLRGDEWVASGTADGGPTTSAQFFRWIRP